MILKNKFIVVIMLITLISIIFLCSSCSDNRTPGQKAYDFMQMFDRRSHLKFRGGVYEHDEGKAILLSSANQSGEEKSTSHSLALRHFQKARAFFVSAKENAAIIKITDENAMAAVNNVIIASELYIEATDVYIELLKVAADDDNYNVINFPSDLFVLEYNADKKILEAHENIRIFEDKYPEIFTEEWKIMIDELIKEQQLRLEKTKSIYDDQY